MQVGDAVIWLCVVVHASEDQSEEVRIRPLCDQDKLDLGAIWGKVGASD